LDLPLNMLRHTFREYTPWSVVFFAFWMVGCSTNQAHRKAGTFEAASTKIPKVRTGGFEARDVFLRAGAAFREKDYAQASALYVSLVEKEPEGRYANVARFNGALSLERLGRYLEAVPLYKEVAQRTAGSKDAHDALFRGAICLQSAERWREAAELWSRILKPEFPHISIHDRIEAHVGRAWSQEKMGDMARAEQDYKAVFSLHRTNLDNRLIRTTPLVALAHQRVGYLYGSLVESIKIVLPVDRMARDIEEKASYFLKAQSHLLDAIRRHHPKHSLAAGHRLGALYESFYQDLMNSEVPEDLGTADNVIYIRELKKKVRPLIEKAAHTYRRTIELGDRLDFSGQWTKMARQSLQRLELFIAAEAVKERTPKE
jgi:tetratricopeptide (TPR) repeat protein